MCIDYWRTVHTEYQIRDVYAFDITLLLKNDVFFLDIAWNMNAPACTCLADSKIVIGDFKYLILFACSG